MLIHIDILLSYQNERTFLVHINHMTYIWSVWKPLFHADVNLPENSSPLPRFHSSEWYSRRVPHSYLRNTAWAWNESLFQRKTRFCLFRIKSIKFESIASERLICLHWRTMYRFYCSPVLSRRFLSGLFLSSDASLQVRGDETKVTFTSISRSKYQTPLRFLPELENFLTWSDFRRFRDSTSLIISSIPAQIEKSN